MTTDPTPTPDQEREEHLRNHLTDGWWHDSCPYCLRRRVYGGTGIQESRRD